MANHTPGPWTALNTGFVHCAGKRLDPRVAYVYGDFVDCPKGERDANLDIIASAPALYEAAKRALDHMIFRGWAVQADHELRESYEQLKAAVELAEGRQK